MRGRRTGRVRRYGDRRVTSTRATSTSPPLGRTFRRTRVPVTRDMKARTARQPARAPTLRTRAKMGADLSLAESTATSVAPPGRARVHATLGGMEAAVRQPARAPTLRSRPRMEATVVSIAESTATSVAPPGRARVHAKMDGREAAVRRLQTLQPRRRIRARVEAPPTS